MTPHPGGLQSTTKHSSFFTYPILSYAKAIASLGSAQLAHATKLRPEKG